MNERAEKFNVLNDSIGWNDESTKRESFIFIFFVLQQIIAINLCNKKEKKIKVNWKLILIK